MKRVFNVKVDGVAYDVEVEEVQNSKLSSVVSQASTYSNSKTSATIAEIRQSLGETLSPENPQADPAENEPEFAYEAPVAVPIENENAATVKDEFTFEPNWNINANSNDNQDNAGENNNNGENNEGGWNPSANITNEAATVATVPSFNPSFGAATVLEPNGAPNIPAWSQTQNNWGAEPATNPNFASPNPASPNFINPNPFENENATTIQNPASPFAPSWTIPDASYAQNPNENGNTNTNPNPASVPVENTNPTFQTQFTANVQTNYNMQITGNNSVLAPMPGTISNVNVAEGVEVHCGDVLCTLISGNLESDIMSPVDAKVVSILANPGAKVSTNDVIITLS
jgi:biotin carboxyl carrier protein